MNWRFISICLPGDSFLSGFAIRLITYDSAEASIQPKASRSLCNQASTLRGIVRYLENTMQCQIFPRYKISCASSLVRLGFHRSLVGGISSRPNLPMADQAMQGVTAYSSLPDQGYPLNVRLPIQILPDHAGPPCPLPAPLPFSVRHNLYQKVKKYLRLKKPLASISESG